MFLSCVECIYYVCIQLNINKGKEWWCDSQHSNGNVTAMQVRDRECTNKNREEEREKGDT